MQRLWRSLKASLKVQPQQRCHERHEQDTPAKSDEDPSGRSYTGIPRVTAPGFCTLETTASAAAADEPNAYEQDAQCCRAPDIHSALYHGKALLGSAVLNRYPRGFRIRMCQAVTLRSTRILRCSRGVDSQRSGKIVCYICAQIYPSILVLQILRQCPQGPTCTRVPIL